MVACICHNLSESEIKKLLSENSLSDTMLKSGFGTSCGRCIPFYSEYYKDDEKRDCNT